MPAAQKLWHVSKAHLLELFKEGFWRRAAVLPATLAALRTRHALAVPMNAMPIFKGRATIVPRPEPPWLVKPEEQPVMMVPLAEVTMLETRHMIEPEHEVAIAELEHQTALAEVPEVPRLERTMLSKHATMVELEAMVSQVELRPRVRREMARTETSVTCLGWLRRHRQCRHDSCEHHHFAHPVAP